MSQQKVRDTIINSAKVALDGKAVAWPNKIFKPSGGTWFSVHYMPGKPRSVTLGLLGEDELDAVLQIDVNVPTDSGEKDQMAALAALEAAFPPGKVIEHDDQSARVMKTARSNGRVVNTDWRVSFSIYFISRYTRPDPTV